ncbi:MAG: hypothetical protein ACR2MZ_03395 [Candidatus Dormibacter sp.]|uniref:hypothetical protein n=1 Tax=Candidatus Dormibacter sp. TaxID=2973982 RepID=UPI003D9BBCE9
MARLRSYRGARLMHLELPVYKGLLDISHRLYAIGKWQLWRPVDLMQAAVAGCAFLPLVFFWFRLLPFAPSQIRLGCWIVSMWIVYRLAGTETPDGLSPIRWAWYAILYLFEPPKFNAWGIGVFLPGSDRLRVETVVARAPKPRRLQRTSKAQPGRAPGAPA